jgi:hypothetical protein
MVLVLGWGGFGFDLRSWVAARATRTGVALAPRALVGATLAVALFGRTFWRWGKGVLADANRDGHDHPLREAIASGRLFAHVGPRR